MFQTCVLQGCSVVGTIYKIKYSGKIHLLLKWVFQKGCVRTVADSLHRETHLTHEHKEN